MRNPLSLRVESWIGVALLVALAIFMGSFMYSAMANFNSDMAVLDSTNVQPKIVKSIRAVPETERALIDQWLSDSETVVTVPAGIDKYIYISRQYKDKPWLK